MILCPLYVLFNTMENVHVSHVFRAGARAAPFGGHSRKGFGIEEG
jgi:hypothetical protein